VVVFRSFVELLLVVAQFKFSHPELDKNLEALFENNISPNAITKL